MGIDVEQAACDVGVQLVEVLRQITALFEVQRALQAHHDAACTTQGIGFFFDGAMNHVTLGLGQALDQAIKQHLNELNVVGTGHTGDDLNRTVAVEGALL